MQNTTRAHSAGQISVEGVVDVNKGHMVYFHDFKHNLLDIHRLNTLKSTNMSFLEDLCYVNPSNSTHMILWRIRTISHPLKSTDTHNWFLGG